MMRRGISSGGASAREGRGFGARLHRHTKCLPLYLMTVPGLLYLLINNYLPIAGLSIAFKQFDARKGLFFSPWIGLDNFRYLFNDMWVITRNTILYNAGFIVLNVVLGIFVAILLSELLSTAARKVYQSVVLLPYLISTVIVSYLVFAFLSVESGFLNKTILPLLGVDSVAWYNDASKWPWILNIVNVWKNTGYYCVLFLSTIIGIDRGYYEAASIEGATKIQQIIHITLPLIKPVTIMLVLLAIGRIFYSDFGLFYQVPMNSGSIYSTTNVIDTYVYRALLKIGNIGMSSAAGLYQSVVGFVLVLVSNLVVRKVDPDNALF